MEYLIFAHNAIAIGLWIFLFWLMYFFISRKKWRLWIRLLCVGAVISFIVFGIFVPRHLDKQKMIKEQERRQANRKEADAYFEKVCAEKAGYFQYKEIPIQESVYLMKPIERPYYGSDQYWEGDAYTHTQVSSLESSPTSLLPILNRSTRDGFKFVEIKDHENQEIVWRYFLLRPSEILAKKVPFTDVDIDSLEVSHRWLPVESWKNNNEISHLKGREDIDFRKTSVHSMEKKAWEEVIEPVWEEARIHAKTIQSRYGVNWQDISTKEDRDYWVACSKRQIVELKTGEVVAERIGCGTAVPGHQRPPWQSQIRCPNTQKGKSNFLSSIDRAWLYEVLRHSSTLKNIIN